VVKPVLAWISAMNAWALEAAVDPLTLSETSQSSIGGRSPGLMAPTWARKASACVVPLSLGWKK
jgi:hypothetical protein